MSSYVSNNFRDQSYPFPHPTGMSVVYPMGEGVKSSHSTVGLLEPALAISQAQVWAEKEGGQVARKGDRIQ